VVKEQSLGEHRKTKPLTLKNIFLFLLIETYLLRITCQLQPSRVMMKNDIPRVTFLSTNKK